MDNRFKQGQWGQDSIFEKLCYPNGNEKHTGIFLEVGAWDGVDISNTYYLEKIKGWSGLIVEPIEKYFNDCQQNRWCNVWKGCVYDVDGEVNFSNIKGYSEMLSCILESCHPIHQKRIKDEISKYDQKIETIKLPCKTLNSLLDSYNMKQVDILSLDCQTVDLKVLEAYSVEKNPIKAILMDFNNANTKELKDWFERNGYKLYWKHETSDEYLYVNDTLTWSWESSTRKD